MRVCFDPQTFLRQRTGGISRLFTDIIAAFYRDPALGIQPEVPLRLSNNAYLTGELADRGFRSTPRWLPRPALYAPWWLRGSRYGAHADIIHHTYYSRRFLNPDCSRPQVTTVYDMIPELFAGTESFTASHLQKLEYVSHCDLVICISESTRRDMEEVYGPIARRTVVIPLAVGAGFATGLPRLDGLPHDYLLYVGARDGYKDFSLLPAALQDLRSNGHDIPLVLVGKPLGREEAADLEARGLSSACQVLQLDDKGLRRAYANCTAVVQTSRYEGFGLTPLEGMASGAPVIVARASSMPEVCGDVGLYFEPGDATDLAARIEQVLDNDELRAALSRRGVTRAEEFSTRRLVERTATAYRDLLST